MRQMMQRLFPTFPRGWPGVGLLLLRAAVGVTAILQAMCYLSYGDGLTPRISIFALLTAASGISLLVGILTPLACVIAGLSTLGVMFSWFPRPTPNLLDATLPAILVVVVAVSVAFLGPGALSLDARIFGRREVIIPRLQRVPNSMAK